MGVASRHVVQRTEGEIGASGQQHGDGKLGNARTKLDQAQLHATRHFGLLRTPAESLPATVWRLMREPIVGVSWDHAQKVPTYGAGAYWLVPGERGLCLLAKRNGLSMVCTSVEQAIRSGISLVELRPNNERHSGKRVLVGVGPDGADKAYIWTKGAVVVVPISRHGVFRREDGAAHQPDLVKLHRSRAVKDWSR